MEVSRQALFNYRIVSAKCFIMTVFSFRPEPEKRHGLHTRAIELLFVDHTDRIVHSRGL